MAGIDGVGPHAVVQPLSHEVQALRPFPRLKPTNSLGGRQVGVVQPEAGKELDDDRAPLAPGFAQGVSCLAGYGRDPNPFA
jgi:hypothetical protein